MRKKAFTVMEIKMNEGIRFKDPATYRNGFFLSNPGLWIGFALIVCLFIILYYPVISYLINNWTIDENYSHGFIVPFISGYLIWEKREVLRNCRVMPNPLGLIIVFIGILLLIIGEVGAELFTTRISMLFVIGGMILYLLGKDFLKNLIFPLGYLVFMIPLPQIIFNSVAFPLQNFSAMVATGAIQFFGVPVLREGNLIHLAYNTLEVVEACSGIRSLITMLALSVILAHVTQNRLWKKLIVVFSAVPIAILANAMRITGTGILSHYIGIAAAQGFYHTFSGWFLFVIAFAFLFLTCFLLRRIK